jgi:CRISPR system Cascade subunit CasD
MRLVAPMQSWGIQSRFEVRDTLTEPTKSGVIGLVCAALGRDRKEPIHDLASLRMGIRIDREGIMQKEYQTALSVVLASSYKDKTEEDKTGVKACQPSTRYYLADAAFLVGLESDDKRLLEAIDAAIRNPHWTIFLGRKSFVASEPIFLPRGSKQPPCLMEHPLEEALRAYPRISSRESLNNHSESVRFVIECGDNIPSESIAVFTRPDNPVSFSPRNFSLRTVAVVSRPATECFSTNVSMLDDPAPQSTTGGTA